MTGFVVICFAVLFAQQVFADETVSKQACYRAVSISPSLVEKAYNGEISNNRELKCFFKCYYENEGIMDDKGVIHADKMIAKVPKDTKKTIAEKAVNLCMEHKGKDACENAYVVQKCMLNNNIKI